MNFLNTTIPEVIEISPKIFGDDRGFFLESFRKDLFCSAGINYDFVQDNHSGSRKGILRGLHYQIQHPQGKLVRAVVGEIFDVAVDIRKKSPTFGKWVGVILTEKNHKQLWIPPGFAHGFYVISDWAEVYYKTSDYYAPEYERSIIWNDPSIGIKWPLNNGELPILSDKDKLGMRIINCDLFD